MTKEIMHLAILCLFLLLFVIEKSKSKTFRFLNPYFFPKMRFLQGDLYQARWRDCFITAPHAKLSLVQKFGLI